MKTSISEPVLGIFQSRSLKSSQLFFISIFFQKFFLICVSYTNGHARKNDLQNLRLLPSIAYSYYKKDFLEKTNLSMLQFR